MGLPQDAPAGQQLGRAQGLSSRHPGRLPPIPTVATLYKRGDAYYLNWRQDGAQVRRSLGKIERRQAEAIRAEKAAELAGLITATRGITVGAVLADYLVWYEKARPSTYKRALSALRPFRVAHDHYPAESLPASTIERWAHAQTATGQAEKALKLARAAFRRWVKQRKLSHSPMDGVTIPKPMTSRAPDYYRPEDLEKLAKTPRAAIWEFMVSTGIRRGEMAKARDADIRDGLLYVESLPEGRTKNLRWRAIPINAAARAARKRLGRDALVTAHADTLSDWFAADARSVGLKGSLHWLRHTFCTALVQSGVSLHEVKRLAGHSSITVTEKYAHHAPGFGRAAVDTMAGWRRRKPASKSTIASTRKR
jgi:site-specific recombinase XerD